MEPLDQLREWGYTVGGDTGVPSQVADDVNVWWIEGFGLSTYVREDDVETLAQLVDVDAHEERVKQLDETPAETQARWVREGKVPPPRPVEAP